jgi:predicted O-methyltransferase YrrM
MIAELTAEREALHAVGQLKGRYAQLGDRMRALHKMLQRRGKENLTPRLILLLLSRNAGNQEAAPKMDTPAVTSLRHRVKIMVRSERYRWFAAPARIIWYYWRTITDLKNVPSFFVGFSRSMRSLPYADLIDLVFTRFGGILRPFQNKNELQRFIERAASIKAKIIVEIGTARGGSLFLLSCAADPRALLVSIDLPAGFYGGGYPVWKSMLFRRFIGKDQSLRLIRGNSHKAATFDPVATALRGRKTDLLFIDGDHSYDGVKKDFIQYRTLVLPGGLIVFHDILESRKDKSITVAPLWQEIAHRYQTEEIVESYAQGEFGIGVLTVPEQWE